MNPNGQTPLDYLNQIAPQAPKKQGFGLNLKTVVIVGRGLLVLALIIGIIAGLVGSGPATDWQRLSLRLATTEAIAEDSDALIKNSQLRSINSEIKLYITDTNRDLTTRLEAKKIDPEKASDTIIAAEANADMLDRLESGRLNAKYDSTYAREMTYQIGTILALYQKLNSSTNSAADKEFLANAYENLAPIQQRLTNFSASSE